MALTRNPSLSQCLCDLEDLRPFLKPLIRSGVYIESFGYLNHIETWSLQLANFNGSLGMGNRLLCEVVHYCTGPKFMFVTCYFKA